MSSVHISFTKPFIFCIRTAASAGCVQARGAAAQESSSRGVRIAHLSGKGSQAATRLLLEAQQTGTVHVESAGLLGSHWSAGILYDHLSVTSYALRFSFRERW